MSHSCRTSHASRGYILSSDSPAAGSLLGDGSLYGQTKGDSKEGSVHGRCRFLSDQERAIPPSLPFGTQLASFFAHAVPEPLRRRVARPERATGVGALRLLETSAKSDSQFPTQFPTFSKNGDSSSTRRACHPHHGCCPRRCTPSFHLGSGKGDSPSLPFGTDLASFFAHDVLFLGGMPRRSAERGGQRSEVGDDALAFQQRRRWWLAPAHSDNL